MAGSGKNLVTGFILHRRIMKNRSVRWRRTKKLQFLGVLTSLLENKI